MANRFEFIDGLRGIAACQVVLLHYCAAFLPTMARVGGSPHYAWESSITRSPFFFLIDGYSAVYLFFIMSGFVLAPSFIHCPKGSAALAFKRFTRLFIPVLAASFLALALLLLLPGAKTGALGYSKSLTGFQVLDTTH
jgi:peptidoglycan/LPS O-acetylase OafA/YrhL